VEESIRSQLPNYMSMGEKGMHDMAEMHMQGPKNTLPMMAGQGPFGPIAMGGMFTVLKVRDRLVPGADPGWYPNPKGTVSESVSSAGKRQESERGASYTCPMHHDVVSSQPGDCPKCGMALVPKGP
jgi:hypothetical protein